MLEKLKSFLGNDNLFTGLLVVLVGVVSFGLGRQSVLGVTTEPVPARASVGVSLTSSETPSPADSVSVDTVVVASRSGTKYHLPTCPGASQIKEENKISFKSATLAEAAGYTPAANCPGLTSE